MKYYRAVYYIDIRYIFCAPCMYVSSRIYIRRKRSN